MFKSIRRMLAALAVSAIATGVAMAATPVQRSATVVVGSVTYTNTINQAVLQVEKIELFGIQPTDATATVRRVSAGLTNLLGTFVVSGGIGQATNASFYAFKNDEIRVTGAGTNAGTVRLTGNIQP